MTIDRAVRFALDKVLIPFSDSGSYDDYRDCGDEFGFTGEEYREMLHTFEDFYAHNRQR